jgi:hypothetical protein
MSLSAEVAAMKYQIESTLKSVDIDLQESVKRSSKLLRVSPIVPGTRVPGPPVIHMGRLRKELEAPLVELHKKHQQRIDGLHQELESDPSSTVGALLRLGNPQKSAVFDSTWSKT